MKGFFKSLAASMVALFLFGGACLLFLLLLVAAMSPKPPVVPPKAVLVLDLSMAITDSARESGPAEAVQRALQGGEDGVPLSQLVDALDRAAKDKRVGALFLTGNVEASGLASGPAALRELRQALQRFKAESGKPVIAYNQAWSKREYYLAAGCGKVVMNPCGEMDLTGLAAESMFMAGAFKKYGVEVQVTRVGRFKSAVEPYILDRMSDANREQMSLLLGDIWDEWKTTVAADRKKTPQDIQVLSDEKGLLLPKEALQAGLVDKLAYYDEVLDELKTLAGRKGSDREFPQIDMQTYLKVEDPSPSRSKNRIAVLYAEGEIVDGEGKAGEVGGERVARELRKLRLDKDVKAVVLRVNSPGGSALASDLIQREVIVTRKVKPVVVSMGHLAASGGYWISIYGDRVFAEPTTITGSIGVFGMLPNVKALANGHGITWDTVQTSRLANLGTISRPKTPAELARIQVAVDDIYDQFLSKVAEGRKLKREDVAEIAQGRVWSGTQALKLHLVDELGGLQDAVRHAAKMAKIEKDFRVDAPEPAGGPVERILKAMGGGEKRKLTRVQGPAERVRAEFEAVQRRLEVLNDPCGVYARLPFDVVLR